MCMNPLVPIITDHGLQALFVGHDSDFEARIAQLALGTSGYTVAVNPDGYATQSTLKNEVQRVEITNGKRAAPHQLELHALVEGDQEYWVRELGFYLEDGTLFAIWSDEKRALAWKGVNVPLVLALELVLNALPANRVNVVTGAASLELLLSSELAAVGNALSNVQREQLRLAERVKYLDGDY